MKHFIIWHSVIICILSNISACSLHNKAYMNQSSFKSDVRYRGNSNNRDNETISLIQEESTIQQAKGTQNGLLVTPNGLTLTPKARSQANGAAIGTVGGLMIGGGTCAVVSAHNTGNDLHRRLGRCLDRGSNAQ